MTDLICDLDGVLFRGDTPVDGAGRAIERFREAGGNVLFVTNNASRTPEYVAETIERVNSVACDPADVITATMAAAPLLRPEDLPVFGVGEHGISGLLEQLGLAHTDDAGEANSVMVGVDRNFTYQKLAEASSAVRSGARFIATNNDFTFPAPNGQLLPGAGSLVGAISIASGVEPEIAGKPHQPMRDLIKTRFRGHAWVVGDRLDSDISMARAEPDWTSILVLTGVTTPEEDTSPADHVAADLKEAVDLILQLDRA